MFSSRITAIEKMILLLVSLILITGIFLLYTDPEGFNWFIREDNLVEWLTVIALLLASIVCFYRCVALFSKKKGWFLLVNFVLGLLLFVAAGEEISWGQRIFEIESSDYFKQNNLQGETNLHNLEINGVKINKLVFSTILSVFLAIYLLILPLVYNRNSRFRHFIDSSGVSVPVFYQVIAFVIVFGATALIKHDKSPELLECSASFLFFLVIAFPANKSNFK